MERLKPGDLWMDELEAALVRSQHLIVYVGPLGVRNWVGREVHAALDRNTADASFRLIPVLGPGADAEKLPLFLKQHHWLDLRHGADPVPQLQALLQSVAGRTTAQTSLLGPNQSPFRGLFAFEEEDALLFYGRDREVDQLVKKLAQDRFLAVVGDSGSGKSSLVKAGLIPALHGGRLALATGETAGWRVSFARPGDPFRELAESLAHLDSGSSAAERTAFVAEAKRQMASGTEGLRNAIAGLQLPRTTRVLLLIDQFEELFTGGAAKDEQLRYIDNVLAAVPAGTDRHVHVVITLRADFYSPCWIHPELPQRIAANQFAVQRMNRTQFREAIEKPLALAGVCVEPGLVDALLNEVGDEPGNLPLLEHALEQLWEKRRAGVITNAAYEEIGRLKGSLRKYADGVYEGLGDEKKRAIVRKILVRLTQLGEGSQDTRRRATKPELFAAAGGRAESEPVLNKLISARLLSVGADVVEVAHEALIREWPLLREWLSEDRQDLRVERSISRAAAEWDSFAGDTGALLKGAKLAQAEEWSARHPGELPDLAIEFLRISIGTRDEDVRQEQQRQQQQSAETESRLLAAQAQQALLLDPASSLALAIRAVRRFKTTEAEETLEAALGRPRTRVILNHDGRVLSVAFSPDGKRVLTASEDNSARVWDADSGHMLTILAGHQDGVLSAKFSPDGKRVVTASNDHSARVWDAQTGQPQATLRGHQERVIIARFSPDCERVVTASADRTARLWDAGTGNPGAILTGHEGTVNAAEFSRDGKLVLTASDDGTVGLWDVETGNLVTKLTAGQERIRAAHFSSDGKLVLTASDDKNARFWNTLKQECGTFMGQSGIVNDAAFSPDDKSVVTANDDRTAWIWNVTSRMSQAKLTGHHDRVLTAAFSSDGKQVVTASSDQTARIWDVDSGRTLATLEGHRGHVVQAAFSPDGRRVATASLDKSARVWDIGRGRTIASFAGQSIMFCAAFSPDRKRIVTASADHTAQIWDAENGSKLVTLSGHQYIVMTAAFSPDGRRVVTADGMGTVQVWDAYSGRTLSTLSGHGESVGTAEFSCDGLRIVTASADQTARVWDAESGRTVATLTGHSDDVLSAAFSSDGQRVLTASADGTARVWETESGRALVTLNAHKSDANRAAFSPNGKWIVTPGKENTACVWDAGSGLVVATLTGHEKPVLAAVFSPDGLRVVTGSADETARVWDVATGYTLAKFTGHRQVVWSAAFSPDGKRVVTAGGDTSAQVWDAATGQVLANLTGHDKWIRTAAFSRDGKRIVTASDDYTARVYIVDLDDLLAWAESQPNPAAAP